MTTQQVEISFLSQKFSIVTNEDPNHVHHAAQRVQAQIDELRESGLVMSSDRLMALVALNLAGELIKQEASGQTNLAHVVEELDSLVEQANSLAKVPLR